VLQVQPRVAEVVRAAAERVGPGDLRAARDGDVLGAPGHVGHQLQAAARPDASDTDEVPEGELSLRLRAGGEGPDRLLDLGADLPLELEPPHLLLRLAEAELAERDPQLG